MPQERQPNPLINISDREYRVIMGLGAYAFTELGTTLITGYFNNVTDAVAIAAGIVAYKRMKKPAVESDSLDNRGEV